MDVVRPANLKGKFLKFMICFTLEPQARKFFTINILRSIIISKNLIIRGLKLTQCVLGSVLSLTHGI